MTSPENAEQPLASWERYVFGFDTSHTDFTCEVTAIYSELTKQLRIVDVEFPT